MGAIRQALPFQGDDALVTLRIGALIDREGNVPTTQDTGNGGPGIGLEPGNGVCVELGVTA